MGSDSIGRLEVSPPVVVKLMRRVPAPATGFAHPIDAAHCAAVLSQSTARALWSTDWFDNPNLRQKGC
jgi:hypothetical protein